MKNLRKLREEEGLTQRQFAEKMQLAKTTIVFYEQGKISPSVDTMLKMADFFGVSVDYLLGHETAQIVHLDSYTENQQKAIELMKKLNDDEMLILLGYLASLTNTPLEEVAQKKV